MNLEISKREELTNCVFYAYLHWITLVIWFYARCSKKTANLRVVVCQVVTCTFIGFQIIKVNN